MVLGLMSVCTAWMYAALKTGKIKLILFIFLETFLGHLGANFRQLFIELIQLWGQKLNHLCSLVFIISHKFHILSGTKRSLSWLLQFLLWPAFLQSRLPATVTAPRNKVWTNLREVLFFIMGAGSSLGAWSSCSPWLRPSISFIL